MTTKEELKRLLPIRLASLCGQVAKHSSADSETKEKASQLVRKCRRLLPGQSHPVSAERKKAEAAMKRLKTQMVEFLADHPDKWHL